MLGRAFWIFDMDGTLTVAAHDFDQFKLDHGLPVDRDILGSLADLSPGRRAEVEAAIEAWELDVADQARPAPDALPLLEALREREARMGILTRNSKEGARRTLSAAGLAGYFPDPADIVGRECCAHKPAPDGIYRLLHRWAAPAPAAVMVGDYMYDVMAGRAAGTATVLVARDGDPPASWAPWIDLTVRGLDELLRSDLGQS